MAWQAVIGRHLVPLPCDERGVWRSPDGELEALLFDGRGTVAAAIEAAGWDGADAYVHWLPEYAPLPVDAATATPRLCAVWGDWNVAGRAIRLLRDVLAAAAVDLPGVERLRHAGYERVAAVLPWGWDPGTGSHPVEAPREVDVLFAGSRNPAIHAERERLLARLAALGDRHRVEIVSGVSPEEFQALLRRAKLVFNRSVRGEANMRAFEAAAQGACVLNERGNAQLDTLFGEDMGYASYGDDLEDVIDVLLADEPRRLGIARTGQETALRHSYEAHLRETLRALRDLSDAPPPPPAPHAWRDLLLEQWRLTRAADPAEILTGLPPALAARHLALDVERDPARALAAGVAALEAGAEQDAPFLLALAEGALGTDVRGAAEAALAVLNAPPAGTFAGIPTPDYGDWRLALEQAVLAADDDSAAAAAAHDWVRSRAAWILAAGLSDHDAGRALALLDPDATGPAPLLFLRGRLRLRVGERDRALADLERLAAQRPTDPTVREALTEALAA